MRRLISNIFVAVLFVALLSIPAHAQVERNGFYFANPCIGLVPMPNFGLPATGTALCWDTNLNTLNSWNGTAFVIVSNGTSTLGSPLVLNGTSTGSISVSSGATPTAHTTTLKAVQAAQGDIVDYSNASGQQASLADVATGQLLASGGLNVVPAYTATPSVSTVTATSTGDKAIVASNGGHISNPIGSGTPPTGGTGSVTSGGTDTAMIVTGATSPVTMTFGTAFAAAPICVCSNISTAAHGCAVSSPGTTSVVVTTASTDSFSMICIGH